MQVQDPDTDTGVLGSANMAPPDAPMSKAAQQANPYSSWSPGYAGIMKAGLEDGHSAHQIAAVLGNAMAESKGDPTASHDGGSGFGMWGHGKERKAALLKYAADNGYDPADPYGQAKFMFAEQRGEHPGGSPENANKLWLNADDADSANRGIVRTERFNGWQNPNTPNGQLARLANTNGWLGPVQAAMAGQQADPYHQGPSGANPVAYANPDSTPSDGASGAIANALTGRASPNLVAGPGATSSATSGNTGSKPSQPWGNLGDSLTRMGAALMMRDNPTAGQAMLSGINKGNSFSDGGYKKLGNGQYVHQKVNKETGEVTNEVVDKGSVPQDVIDSSEDTTKQDRDELIKQQLALQKIKTQKEAQAIDGGAPLPRGGDKIWSDNEQKLSPVLSSLDRIDALIKEGQDNGYMDQLGPLSYKKAQLSQAMGTATPFDNWVMANHSAHELAAAVRLKAESGQASDKRLEQAREQDSPFGSQYAGTANTEALLRHRDAIAHTAEQVLNTQHGMAQSYPIVGKRPSLTAGAQPGETMSQRAPRVIQQLQDRRAEIQKTIDAAAKNRTTGSPTTGTPPSNPLLQ